MLGDQEIELYSKQLAEYKRNDTLPDILEKYASLIEEHKRLKSDYEEEREGRERYKQMARGQERNPFVLVLVDGDGYIFDDELVRDGTEGGSRASKRLNDTVKHSLRRKGLEHCEVMVRVYANLVGLSKILYKSGLCGAEKRSLAPFTAGFNRSYGLNDFVDAGELKENADFKLRAMLRLYAENAQCKHIYFAACHDVGYISELTPYRGNRDRFTLVSTPSLRFHDEFQRLGMNVEDLPGVFRTIPLDSASTYRPGAPSGPNNNNSNSNKSAATAQSPMATPSVPSDGQKICQFYQVGKCKYGKGCKNAHVDVRTAPFHMSRASRSDSDFGGNNFGRAAATSVSAADQPPPPGTGTGTGTGTGPSSTSIRDGAASDSSYTKTNNNEFPQLPRNDEIPRGYVALNQTEHRLDAYIPAPTNEANARLKVRSERQKLCNTKHLLGACDNEHCEYDHSPISEDLRPALEMLSRSMPCPKRGSCRNASCVYGHVCQRADCKHRGGKVYCRFPYLTHYENLSLDSVVPGITKKQQQQQQPPHVSPPLTTAAVQPSPLTALPVNNKTGSLNNQSPNNSNSNNSNHHRRSPSTDDEDDDDDDAFYHPAPDEESEGEEGVPIARPMNFIGAFWEKKQ